MTNIAIVGAGMMGSATAWPLSDNGHAIRLVGTHLDGEIIQSCKESRYHPRLKRTLPPNVQPYFVEEIAQALDGVQIIVSGVNSLGVRWIGRTIGPYLRPGQRVIAVTKGLEASETGELTLLPDVLRQELPGGPPPGVRDQVSLAAIGGPCIAGELAGRRQSCVVFAGREPQAVAGLAAVFRTPYYHIWTTTDLLSLEVCAALKNAYTLGVGLAAGLLERAGGPDAASAAMHNLAAAIFAQGCREIALLLELLGGDPAFAYALPGAGDLYVTAQGGRTVRLGRLLGLGLPYAEARQVMAGETLESAEIVRQMAGFLRRGARPPLGLPLLRLLVEVIVDGRRLSPQPADLPLEAFFQPPLARFPPP